MEHKELEAWQKAMQFAENIYKTTEGFPEHERYGLVSQIRRAVVSIPSNIAEGSSRNSKKEYIRFINIALGSLSELETQLILSHRLKYFNEFEPLNNEMLNVKMLILGIKRYLNQSI
jgi:four helix bundle protein